MYIGVQQRVDCQRAEKLLSGYRGQEVFASSSERIEDAALPSTLQQGGITSSQWRTIGFGLALSSVACGMAAMFLSKLFLAGVILSPLAFWCYLKRKVVKRAEAFERDYPALLLSLASSVRTGLDPLAALIRSDRLFRSGSEMRRELEVLRKSIEDGASEDDAVRSFASSVDHPDIKLFRTAFLLARKEGSSLGSCLQRLTRVTRQRQSFRRKMRAAIAMQKFSSIGIALCTVAIGMMQFFMNPEAFRAALHHPVGSRILLFGALLMALGLGWMMRLGRSRI